jgi:integrase/recombinase XerD
MNENEQLNIYQNRERTFERELVKLQKEDISNKNKKLITTFQNYLFSTGSKYLRVSKLSSQLRFICRWLLKALNIERNLDELNKNDLLTLVSFINRMSNKSEATKNDYRRCIKQFFLWFKDEDPFLFSNNAEIRFKRNKFYKYIEKEIKGNFSPKKIDPSTIITDQEIRKIAENGAISHRDKAFLMLLHETGARAGEFLNLRIENIAIKENIGEIYIPYGKTGPRQVLIRNSLPFLLKYLEVHPFRDNIKSFLWLSCANHNLNKPILHRGGQKIIDRCFNLSDIKKKHNFHWFRHSRATILAPKITEVILCKYMGWSIGSRQVRNYVHLCKSQMEEVFLSMHNLKENEEKQNKPIKCICGVLNDPNSRYCFKCFQPLNVETIIQDKALIDSEIGKTLQIMMEMAKDPKMIESFKKFKEQNI